VQARCRFEAAPAVDWLRQAAAAGETFEFVIVDPPPFIPVRKDAGPGRRSYLGLYRLALRVTAPGGVAVICSRSYHLPEADFERVIFEAAARERRSVQHLWRGGAGPDHPRPMAMPETCYLKCAFLSVS
jgi:23S rRNA (cytosine1962-C5)-methyltransferase